jgi:hypothetical protein
MSIKSVIAVAVGVVLSVASISSVYADGNMNDVIKVEFCAKKKVHSSSSSQSNQSSNKLLVATVLIKYKENPNKGYLIIGENGTQAIEVDVISTMIPDCLKGGFANPIGKIFGSTAAKFFISTCSFKNWSKAYFIVGNKQKSVELEQCNMMS